MSPPPFFRPFSRVASRKRNLYMELASYFDGFLANTGPTSDQKQVMLKAHTDLRERLMADAGLKNVLLATFIQGSQRRHTANCGSNTHPCDVDIVAVTNFPRGTQTAAAAHGAFEPFLKAHYAGRYTPQDRSWCIAINDEVKLDLVPTSEPDSPQLHEMVKARSLTQWNAEHGSGTKVASGVRSLADLILEDAERDQDYDKSEPLWIPDRERKTWEQTHPLFLLGWTARKNKLTSGHFIHVVRAIKWWRREVQPLPKYPKGYPLEHLVGECCPDGIRNVASGVAATFAEIGRRYAVDVARRTTPSLRPRGINDVKVDVMRRVSAEDFAGFHAKVLEASRTASDALAAEDVRTSARLWRSLLGPAFPLPPNDDGGEPGGFVPPKLPAQPRESRFA